MENQNLDNLNDAKKNTSGFEDKKKPFSTKFFDKLDELGRQLYGKRVMFFVWGALFVLIVAPIFDELFGISEDWITYFSTFLFLIFILVLLSHTTNI